MNINLYQHAIYKDFQLDNIFLQNLYIYCMCFTLEMYNKFTNQRAEQYTRGKKWSDELQLSLLELVQFSLVYFFKNNSSDHICYPGAFHVQSSVL